jgi:hypothetical protein
MNFNVNLTRNQVIELQRYYLNQMEHYIHMMQQSRNGTNLITDDLYNHCDKQAEYYKGLFDYCVDILNGENY